MFSDLVEKSMTESVMTTFGLLSGQDASPPDSWFLSQLRHHLDETEILDALKSFAAFGLAETVCALPDCNSPPFGVFRQSYCLKNTMSMHKYE